MWMEPWEADSTLPREDIAVRGEKKKSDPGSNWAYKEHCHLICNQETVENKETIFFSIPEIEPNKDNVAPALFSFIKWKVCIMLSRKTDRMGLNYGVATWSLIIQSVVFIWSSSPIFKKVSQYLNSNSACVLNTEPCWSFCFCVQHNSIFMRWTKCGVFREEFVYLSVGGLNQWLAVCWTMRAPKRESARSGT